MKNLCLHLLLFLSPLLILFVWAQLSSNSRTLFPSGELFVSPYCDQSDSLDSLAQSTIDRCIDQEGVLTVEYTLRTGAAYPYAGVSLNPSMGTWDISDCAYIEVMLQAHNLTAIRISLQALVDGVEITKEYEQEVNGDMQRYRIPLKAFEVPSWWYVEKRKTPESVDLRNFYRTVRGIAFENPSVLQLDVPSTMRVKGVKVGAEKSWMGLLALLWTGGFLLLLAFRWALKSMKVQGVTYKRVVIDDPDEALLQRAQEYAGLNFSDPEVTISEVSRKVGCTPKRLARLFRENHSCTFKQFVNHIRLKEAHRLVVEEDHPITSILLAVGFNSSSYFNRLFAKEFQISPTDLRKQVRAK